MKKSQISESVADTYFVAVIYLINVLVILQATAMDATSLKITNCDDNYCIIELCFDSTYISLLHLLQADKLRYEIDITNTSKWKTKLFSTERNRKKTNEFNVPLTGIPGDSEDVFDIKVMAYRFKPGQEEPLLFHQRKLKNIKLLPKGIQTLCTRRKF